MSYEIRWSRPAKRAIAEQLSGSGAAAAIELITESLADNPHRVGKPLRPPLTGVWSARRADYRVLYRIDEDKQTVIIQDVRPRRTAYT